MLTYFDPFFQLDTIKSRHLEQIFLVQLLPFSCCDLSLLYFTVLRTYLIQWYFVLIVNSAPLWMMLNEANILWQMVLFTIYTTAFTENQYHTILVNTNTCTITHEYIFSTFSRAYCVLNFLVVWAFTCNHRKKKPFFCYIFT